MFAATDWTNVLIALIAGCPAILSAVFAYLIHRDNRLPSGGSLGEAVEQARDLSAATVAHTTRLIERGVNVDAGRAPGADAPRETPT